MIAKSRAVCAQFRGVFRDAIANFGTPSDMWMFGGLAQTSPSFDCAWHAGLVKKLSWTSRRNVSLYCFAIFPEIGFSNFVLQEISSILDTWSSMVTFTGLSNLRPKKSSLAHLHSNYSGPNWTQSVALCFLRPWAFISSAFMAFFLLFQFVARFEHTGMLKKTRLKINGKFCANIWLVCTWVECLFVFMRVFVGFWVSVYLHFVLVFRLGLIIGNWSHLSIVTRLSLLKNAFNFNLFWIPYVQITVFPPFNQETFTVNWLQEQKSEQFSSCWILVGPFRTFVSAF